MNQSLNYVMLKNSRWIMISFDVPEVTGLQIFTDADDSIIGNQTNNVIDGGGGSDEIDGKLGQDTVLFFTSINDAQISIDQQSGVTRSAIKTLFSMNMRFQPLI